MWGGSGTFKLLFLAMWNHNDGDVEASRLVNGGDDLTSSSSFSRLVERQTKRLETSSSATLGGFRMVCQAGFRIDRLEV